MPSAKRSKIITEFKNFPCKIIFSGTSKVTAADCVLRDFTTVNGPKFPVEDDGDARRISSFQRKSLNFSSPEKAHHLRSANRSVLIRVVSIIIIIIYNCIIVNSSISAKLREF